MATATPCQLVARASEAEAEDRARGRVQVARRIQGRCQVSVTGDVRVTPALQLAPERNGVAIGSRRGKRPKPAHRTAPNCHHVP